MQEIGSEFWEVPVCKEENILFPKGIKWFLSGRTALRYIILDIKSRCKFHTVAIPSWCCESMITPFLSAGIEVVFYPVYIQKFVLAADMSKVLTCDAILIMDYFGYTMNWDLSDYKGIVIRDLTQSVFTKKYSDAEYYFGSLRKWCGTWTGGFAWCREGWYEEIIIASPSSGYVELRKEAMSRKLAYIQGISSDREYLSLFSEAEAALDQMDGIQCADARDVALIKRLDVNGIKKTRRENAERLLETLADYAIFPQISQEDCPLFVPILVPGGKRDELCRYLIQNKIYCPVHWPLCSMHHVIDKTMTLYENELSIICDQRYSLEDMEYLCEMIKGFMEK